MSLNDTYAALDRTTLDVFVRESQAEHLLLDFKTVKSASLNSRDDRRNFACAMSGFANSAGGLIVWGVDARKKGEEGIDCAIGFQPIENLPLLLSRLNQLTSEATSPLIDGVQHRPIPFEGNSGCAVTLVPESASTHMAKLGEDRYYKRNGSSFIRLEHFDLQDMFGRRKRPDLRFYLSLHPMETDPPLEELWFTVSNQGRALAKHVGFMCRLPPEVTVVGLSGPVSNVSSINDCPTVSYDNYTHVLHPIPGFRIRLGSARITREDRSVPLTALLTYYCEDMAAKAEEMIISVSSVGT